LNVPFFILRAGVYFVIWIGISLILNKLSADQDRGGSPGVIRRLQLLSGPGLVLYGLTVSLAAVDWVMSLDPHWFSTIWGLLFIAGQGLSAFSLMIVCLRWLSHDSELSEVTTPPIFNDLGNLMLTFTMLWAYMSFSQFLIIWSGNTAEEIPYYIFRINAGWQFLALFVIVFHFAVPFLLLLSRRTKRDMHALSRLAIAVIIFRLFDLYWMITPQWLQGHNHHINSNNDVPHMLYQLHWLDLAAPVGIGGIWLAAFIWQLGRRPLLPLNDPRLAEMHHHG
jgi:hypothetical protein